MALYDQRTFKWGEDWWVAEVHSAAGAGTGPGRPAMTSERAIFTNLSDPDATSRTIRIPAGSLNQLSHNAIGLQLEKAEPIQGRFDMSPRNAPDEDELGGLRQLHDSEGLLWVYRRKDRPTWSPGGIELRPVLEFICLEDSALRGEVAFNGSDVLDDFLHYHGDSGAKTLIPSITRDFRELDSEWDQ